MAPTTSSRWFPRLAIATTVITYLLISVGAIVRVSGAGMGCPDWPRCFGLWVPPTSVEQLPPLGSYHYPKGWTVESFDPLMTWIEYGNRLLGALTGLFILATFISAIRTQRHNKGVLWPVVGAFVGVLYAGWLGGRVVAHELAPWMVTAHLLSAIFVVSCLVTAVVNATTTTASAPTASSLSASKLAWGGAVVALIQGAIGTQVRGTLDDIARHQPLLPRAERLAQVGLLDEVHRTLALLVAAAVVVLCVVVVKRVGGAGARWSCVCAALVAVQFVVGVVLAYAGLPQVAQVFHLLCGALLLGGLTTTAMLLRR